MKKSFRLPSGRLAAWPPLVFALILMGCAGIFRQIQAGSFQTYPGGRLPREQVAFLLTYIDHPGYRTETDVTAIDGKKLGGGVGREYVEILPGKHLLCVSFSDGNRRSAGCTSLEIEAKPGRLYELYCVKYTRQEAWYPALWDITDELDFPEQSKTRATFDAMLQKTGRAALPPPAAGWAGSAGFGERIKIGFRGKQGRQVSAEYTFVRYAPFVRLDADDGLTYHLQVSQTNGSVASVLATEIYQDRRTAIQPIGSDLASVYGFGVVAANEVFATYREISPGKYRLIRQVFTVFYQNFGFHEMLDTTIVDGQDANARRALVLALNADPGKIKQYQSLADKLMKRSKYDQEGFQKNLNQFALQLAREAAREADILAARYAADDSRYERVSAIVELTKSKLKECEARE